MIYTYAYPRPALTVDMIVIDSTKDSDQILLIKRKDHPFKDQWALPGGFVDIDEEIETAAYRELKEETSITEIKLDQFKTYGTVGRDPRGRTISVIYYGYITNLNQTIKAGDDAKELEWFSVNDLPKLAFDHSVIIKDLFTHTKSS